MTSVIYWAVSQVQKISPANRAGGGMGAGVVGDGAIFPMGNPSETESLWVI